MLSFEKRPLRVITICLFRHEDHLFVFEGTDPSKPETFYRPLGGQVEFQETGRHAIVREIKEEINAEVEGLRFHDTLENIFTFGGKPYHEIVLVYEAQFVDKSFYNLTRIVDGDEEGTPFKAMWMPIAKFQIGEVILYPDGLLDLIVNGSNPI